MTNDKKTPPHGRARLTVDLSRLLYNYRLLRERLLASGTEPMAVVKADAYGHGAVQVACALYGAGLSRFAVSSLSEGLALRTALPSADILILGYTPPEDIALAADAGMTLTVHSLAYAKTVSRVAKRPISAHIKLNSGMNRTGFPLHAPSYDASIEGVLAASALPRLLLSGIYSHLATAEDASCFYTLRQVARFRAALLSLRRRGLSLPAHLAASSAVLMHAAPPLAYARLGLALYGYAPIGCENNAGLLPVARLTVPLAQSYPIPRGEAVGYGADFVARRRERIGILPIGYADGLPRAASGAPIRFGRHFAPIVGRISMDATAVLLTNLPRPSSLATVFGEEAGDLYRLSDAANTIPYEILSGLGPRIVREYQNGEDHGTCDP